MKLNINHYHRSQNYILPISIFFQHLMPQPKSKAKSSPLLQLFTLCGHYVKRLIIMRKIEYVKISQ